MKKSIRVVLLLMAIVILVSACTSLLDKEQLEGSETENDGTYTRLSSFTTMYASGYSAGDVVPVIMSPYNGWTHAQRLCPQNALGVFDAVQGTGFNEKFFAVASREWVEYVFDGRFMNVEGDSDIQFCEVTWGSGNSWHVEAVKVYLTGAIVRDDEGNLSEYGNTDNGIGYYAGIAWNRTGIEYLTPDKRIEVAESYGPGGRKYDANEFFWEGTFGWTGFHLPEEVVSAEGIYLIDITSDVYDLTGDTKASQTYTNGSGYLVEAANCPIQGPGDVIAKAGYSGNTDGYDLDAIRVYKSDKPDPQERETYYICGFKFDDAGNPISGWSIYLEEWDDTYGWGNVRMTETAGPEDPDGLEEGQYCFLVPFEGKFRVYEELRPGYTQVEPHDLYEGDYYEVVYEADLGYHYEIEMPLGATFVVTIKELEGEVVEVQLKKIGIDYNFANEITEVICTLTPGYWRTHSKYGPAPYDETWALLGEDTVFFESRQTYFLVLWTAPMGGNAYYILAHAYIAAELNFLRGADPSDAEQAFNKAKELFEKFTPAQVSRWRGNQGERAEFIRLAGILDAYNNGIIGPGHCD